MPLRNPSTVQFGLRIVLPTILVLVGTIATVLVSLDQMAGEVNRIEERLTVRSVEGAVASVERSLARCMPTTHPWDDAVRSLYGKLDQGFVDENYLSSTATSTFFDTAYLIDEKGVDVFAYRSGEAVAIPSGEAFGPLLAEMIAQLPADGRTYGVKTAC
jgi:sensor domain CHASE-containing protein